MKEAILWIWENYFSNWGGELYFIGMLLLFIIMLVLFKKSADKEVRVKDLVFCLFASAINPIITALFLIGIICLPFVKFIAWWEKKNIWSKKIF